MSIKHISHFLPQAIPKLPLLQVTEVKEFLQMKLPPRETILSPWLPAQGLAIESHVLPNAIYLLKEGLSHQQLSAAINRNSFLRGEISEDTSVCK